MSIIKSIDVVAGIILNASRTKILMSQRTDAEFIDQWEFPGGKIEANESAENALRRELKEELAINVSDCELYLKKSHDYSSKRVNLNFYWVKAFTGAPKGLENQPIKWQDIDTIHELNFLAANKGVVESVQKILQNSNKSKSGQ